MTVLNRFTRLFKADLHGILDCLEEPEAVIAQAVRDMTEVIEREEHYAAELEAKAARLTQGVTTKGSAMAELERQIQLSFEEGDEELARHFVKKKLEAERIYKHIAAELKIVKNAQAVLENKIAEHREELERIIEKRELFSEAQKKTSDSIFECSDSFSVSNEAVEVAFLSEKRKFHGTHGKAAQQ